MNCKNCGAEIKEGVSFCAKCGTRAEFEEAAPAYAPPPPPPPQQQAYTPPPVQQQAYAPPPQQASAPPPQAPKQEQPLNIKLIVIVAGIAAAAVIIVVGGFMGWGPIKFGDMGTPSPAAEAVDEDSTEGLLAESEEEPGGTEDDFPAVEENDFYNADDDIYMEYDEAYWPWEQDLWLSWPEYKDSIRWSSIEKMKKGQEGGYGLGGGITVRDDVKGYVNVRAWPSTKADVVGKLMPGEDAGIAHETYQTRDKLFIGTYYVVDDGYTWIYIYLFDDDYTLGWVATDFITEFTF